VLDSELTRKFTETYEGIMANVKTQEDADRLICAYFKISEKEYEYICENFLLQ